LRKPVSSQMTPEPRLINAVHMLAAPDEEQPEMASPASSPDTKRHMNRYIKDDEKIPRRYLSCDAVWANA
jgi:hypothetical protein